MAYEDYPKNIPESGLAGLVAGGLLAAFTGGNGLAFLLGFFGVSLLVLRLLDDKDKANDKK
jgi:hypothetical protein